MKSRPKIDAEAAFISGATATRADRVVEPPGATIHTSIDLPEDLHQQLKVAAAESRKTMRELILSALRETLAATPESDEHGRK